MQCHPQVYYTWQIWSIVLRCGSRGYLHVLCQGFRGSLALLVDATPRGQSALVTTSGRLVPLGFAHVDEVLPLPSGFLQFLIPIPSNSVPYLIRFRQCLAEYRAPLNRSRRPLYNAVKYATSFPVIYLSAAQRIVVSDLVAERGGQARNESWHGEHQLFRLWCVPFPNEVMRTKPIPNT